MKLLPPTKLKTKCIEVTKNIDTHGYGQIRVYKNKKLKIVQAHRYHWELVNGKIPKGKLIMHKCDNRKCINVKHLQIGTHQDNSDDKIKKKRDRTKTLAKHGTISRYGHYKCRCTKCVKALKEYKIKLKSKSP